MSNLHPIQVKKKYGGSVNLKYLKRGNRIGLAPVAWGTGVYTRDLIP